MVQSALTANDPVWTEILKKNLGSAGVDVREVVLDWVDRHG
jgi:hypothetical protein